VVRIGAAADPETLSVRMLPKINSPSSHKRLVISRAEIRGDLTVTDPAALVDAMTEGIGHGRAYGCGLLLTR
jgi:CRISPR system Cascade subunit CasE